MADAKKCDRCGRFYINKMDVIDKMIDDLKHFFGSDDIVKPNFIKYVCDEYDLCDECKRSLTTWFKTVEKPNE